MGSDVTKKGWHTRSAAETAADLEVDPSVGLTAGEVSARRAQYGANMLTDEARVPVWRKILWLLADRV